MTEATARPRAHRSGTQQRRAPAPRRVSGPARPRPRPVAAPVGSGAIARRGTTTTFDRILAVADHRVVDRLLRSRLWIILVGALLGGIVAMQVSLLKLNSGISRAVETSATLERQNGALEAAIARLGATERVRSTALSRGMVLPPAGEVEYLRVRPDDASLATSRMTEPSEDAYTLLANGGVVPGSLAAVTALSTGTVVAGVPTETTADATTLAGDPTATGTAAATTTGTTDTTATTAAAITAPATTAPQATVDVAAATTSTTDASATTTTADTTTTSATTTTLDPSATTVTP
jgi:hypothetical protein